jgi:hypothetical protein
MRPEWPVLLKKSCLKAYRRFLVFAGSGNIGRVNIEKVQRETGLAAPAGADRLHRGLFIRRRLMASICCRHGADGPSAICRLKVGTSGATVTRISGMANPALLRPNPA